MSTFVTFHGSTPSSPKTTADGGLHLRGGSLGLVRDGRSNREWTDGSRQGLQTEKWPVVIALNGSLEGKRHLYGDEVQADSTDRFAAKEAAFKAISSRRLSWHDITIVDGKIKPSLIIWDASRPNLEEHVAPEADLEEEDGQRNGHDGRGDGGRKDEGQIARLSISHDHDYAIATVMAVDEIDEAGAGVGNGAE